MLDSWLRKQEWMEGWADFIQNLVGWTYGVLGPLGAFLKNVAHGTFVLKHPLHPALTDAPLGAWLVGVILDWLAQYNHLIPVQAGDIALIVGTLAALGAALTGYTDFHETYGLERRWALTHGLIMTTVILIEVVSLIVRWAGNHPVGAVLATVAVLLAMAGMYFGGHLSFGFGTMVNRNAFAEGPAEEFVAVGKAADFPENALKRVDAGGLPALVVRLNGKVCAIGAVCSHAGGPLDEGELNGQTVTCPWHGSKFDVCSGKVKGGPATFGQPRFEVRDRDGEVELKLPEPLH